MKIAGIIRWLERCQNSYKSGAIESALMDAECARADLDDLRNNVWSGVDGKFLVRRSKLKAAACVMISAVILIMFTAVPVSHEKFIAKTIEKNDITVKNIKVGNNNLKNGLKIENNSLKSVKDENLRAERPEIININKDKLKDEKLKAVRRAENVKPVKTERALKRHTERAVRHERVLKSEVKEVKVKVKNEGKAIVPYDKMFSLLETGARALRNETPVIEIK